MPKYVGGYPTIREQREARGLSQPVATGIAKVMQTLAEAYEKKQQQEQDEEIIQKMNNPNLTEMEKAQLALKLSPNGQKALTTALDLYYKLQHQQELQRRHDEEISLRREREERLGKEHGAKDIERLYKSRLSTIKDQLRDARSAEIKPLREEQAALQQELGQNLARLKRGEQPRFDVLQIEEEPLPAQRQGFDTMNQMSGGQNQNIQGATPGINPYAENSGTSYTPNAPQNASRNATALSYDQQPAQQQMNSPAPTKPQRVRWNPQDPAHQARALEILNAAKGDRAAANQQLMQEFER